MVNVSSSERVDMGMLYGVADENARLARELWIERFPNQTHDCGRNRTERILQAEEQILESVEEEPHSQLDLESHNL